MLLRIANEAKEINEINDLSLLIGFSPLPRGS
jgi:hypothetical protein